MKESACQCRSHRFDRWSRKIPHAMGKLRKSNLHLNSRAQEPQLMKPVCLESMLPNKRSHGKEKPQHHN